MSRRVWSKREDEDLTALVQKLGDRRGKDGKWAEISKRLPGRTNKDCRKRWFHSLDPALRKGRWTKEEDEILLATHQRLGPAWKEIALLVKGRKDDQCAKRYNDILNPLAKNRLEDWSPEEDRYLTSKVGELGHRWATIASGLPGRPPLTCRNRWRRLSKSLANISVLSTTEHTSSSDALRSPSSTTTSREFASLFSQDMSTGTPSNPHGLESDHTHLSPGVSETPALSPLFSMGDISYSTLGNPTSQQLPQVSHMPNQNHSHGDLHGIYPRRSNTAHLEIDTGHDVSIPGQPPRPTALPQLEDYYDFDHLWGFMSSENGNSQAKQQVSMSDMQDNQQTSIEEAAMLQALSSTRDFSLIPDNPPSAVNDPGIVQQVQHHHHFHHHHYHHHYHHHQN